MLPILYLILMKRNGTPYSEVTVVSLPSSLMIVHSNAFVFSTSLPEVVFRYGFVFPLSSVLPEAGLSLFFQNLPQLFLSLAGHSAPTWHFQLAKPDRAAHAR